MTNATKAIVGAFISSGINLAVLFGLSLTPEQTTGINVFVDTGLVLYVALTFKNSPKRIPEGLEVDPGPPATLEPEGTDVT